MKRPIVKLKRSYRSIRILFDSYIQFLPFRVLAGEKLWEEKARAYHLSHRPIENSNEEAASSTAPVA